jgi:alpha,alpha-trehalose phosphorylase
MTEPVETPYPVEPWCIRETHLPLDDLGASESLFTLSNGHLGVRGNLDEGEPHGLPGTYLNSVYERRPLPYAEAGYGDPESGQTVINVTNGKIIRLLVDDEPFDLRYGHLLDHERLLDLRAGTLRRSAHWRSPAGQEIKVTSTRLVSFTHRSVMAVSYEVEPVSDNARVVIQSELVANEQLPESKSADPRVAAAMHNPLQSLEHDCNGDRLVLIHETRHSGRRVAAAAEHVVEASDGVKATTDWGVRPDWGRITVTAALKPGQKLRLIKFVSYGWSSQRSVPALRDQVGAGLTGAMHTGWDQLLVEQRQYLDDFWARADVEVDGDEILQQAVRFALFHVLQSGARGEQRPIPAKGLTGPGYDGHCFWDTETFVLPALIHSVPKAAADALRWRHSTLNKARNRARTLGLKGAAFPWRTINGDECSGYWPAGTAAFHINADIADACIRYLSATQDEEFNREIGLELLVETARLWASLGQFDRDGWFRIDGVTGPDEYSAIVDNNVYTNLMAQRNLQAAAEVCRQYGAEAEALDVTDEELSRWRQCAEAMYIPFDEKLGVHPQDDSFTRHAVMDFNALDDADYPLLLTMPYVQLYRQQVVKQADLVLAMQQRSDAFTPEQKAANFAYYEAVTVRDSSLSACTQAIVAAEVGHLDLAYDYTMENAVTDLYDLHANTSSGLHIAALGGVWMTLVHGFGGMRDHAGTLLFAPRLPHGLTRLAFTVTHHGLRLRVETDGAETSYTLTDHGEKAELELLHHGERVTITAGEPVKLAVPPIPTRPRPNQPKGREPMRATLR